jgi:hypothetical protein
MPINVEKIVRDIVDKSYPSDPLLFRASNYSNTPADYQEGREQIRNVGDGSGRKYFMWGHSDWSSDDVIAE